MKNFADRQWLSVGKDETWIEFIEKMRTSPHITKANALATTFKPDQSITVTIQQYILANKLDKKVTGVEDLAKVIALLGVIQGYRENVSSTMVGLMDLERQLKKTYKECESWLMLHPYMEKQKDGDRKRAVYLILQEISDVIGDLEHYIKVAEAAVWALKQGADTFKEQKQGIQTMIYAGMGTGFNPEPIER